jgi:adenosylmethionine-8-amino-7-oxononanoate aminotransferase
LLKLSRRYRNVAIAAGYLEWQGREEPAGKEEVYERFATIWEHLRKHDILVEPAFPGVVSMSVPRDISIAQVREICAECGVVLFDDLLAEMKDEVLEN